MTEFTSRSSRGAASEMFACAHLLRQGYHVFRSVSPACPFDGMAHRDGTSLRFEVKTLNLSPHPAFAWPSNDEWDLLLLVKDNGEVLEYEAPKTYAEVRDHLRLTFGLPPAPVRTVRGSGAAPRTLPKWEPVPLVHGTWSGYLQHRRDDIPMCAECDQARQDFADYTSRTKRKNPVAAQGDGSGT